MVCNVQAQWAAAQTNILQLPCDQNFASLCKTRSTDPDSDGRPHKITIQSCIVATVHL